MRPALPKVSTVSNITRALLSSSCSAFGETVVCRCDLQHSPLRLKLGSRRRAQPGYVQLGGALPSPYRKPLDPSFARKICNGLARPPFPRYTDLVGIEMVSACTVLVVEDEPMIRSHLATMLQDEGCKTYEAGDAAEAIAIMEGNSEITVVFTDIQMPGTMDGIALARYVRRRWPPTIIVVSSGKAEPMTGALANDIPFLPKPYEQRRLTEVIGHVRERLAAA